MKTILAIFTYVIAFAVAWFFFLFLMLLMEFVGTQSLEYISSFNIIMKYIALLCTPLYAAYIAVTVITTLFKSVKADSIAISLTSIITTMFFALSAFAYFNNVQEGTIPVCLQGVAIGLGGFLAIKVYRYKINENLEID